jgi:predicted O-linked N-acetylglucosamine transferase (SPINDLY family)
MEAAEPTRRLHEALQCAESGEKTEAEVRLRALVAEGTRLPLACMALGVLCGERGDRPQRRLWLHQARRLDQAGGKPASLRLLLNLLVDALEEGDLEQALAYGREALVLEPNDGEAHLQQARLLFAHGQKEEGMHHLEQACAGLRARLAEHPNDGKAWRLLATAEHTAERPDAAIEAHRRALAIDPNHLPTLLAISRLLVERGRIDEAMPWLMNALAIAPDDPDVLSLNGCALKTIGEIAQAIDLFRQALDLQPSHLEASMFLGGCLSDQGLFAEAEKVLRKALESFPEHIELRSRLASTLRSLGDLEGAVTIYKELLEEVPDAQGAFNNLMFTYSISGLATPEEVLNTARKFWQRQGVNPESPKPAPLRVEGRALRVGLLSADIGSHVVGRFLDPLLRHHDPKRCQLELISMHRRYEAISETLITLADGFQSLEGLPRSQARDLLRQQNYDLIVDTSGYTRGTGIHLLAERCAPVQAHYIGYHATTGLATIDWFIGDEETAPPEFQDQFSERLYRLPGLWLAYPSDPPFPEARALMQTDRPVLGSFCQVSKITEATLEFWGAALRAVPEALLVLKDRGLQDPAVRERLENALASHGVEGERIWFLAPVVEWRDHVDHYNILDVALDTTPWSSATTGFEALAMGVPLMAIRGHCTAARMSSSLVKAAGYPEWAAEESKEINKALIELLSELKTFRQHKSTRQLDIQKKLIGGYESYCESAIAGFETIAQFGAN